jgi:hypothetical protein
MSYFLSTPKAIQLMLHRKGQRPKHFVTILFDIALTRDVSVKWITVWLSHEYYYLQRYIYQRNFVVIWQQTNIRAFKVKIANIKNPRKRCAHKHFRFALQPTTTKNIKLSIIIICLLCLRGWTWSFTLLKENTSGLFF